MEGLLTPVCLTLYQYWDINLAKHLKLPFWFVFIYASRNEQTTYPIDFTLELKESFQFDGKIIVLKRFSTTAEQPIRDSRYRM